MGKVLKNVLRINTDLDPTRHVVGSWLEDSARISARQQGLVQGARKSLQQQRKETGQMKYRSAQAVVVLVPLLFSSIPSRRLNTLSDVAMSLVIWTPTASSPSLFLKPPPYLEEAEHNARYNGDELEGNLHQA